MVVIQTMPVKPEELVPLTQLTLILGSARSGKSAFAQTMVATHATHVCQQPFYLATAEAHDVEMAKRIRCHQALRDSPWCTIEEPLIISPILARLPAGAPVLLDCLTLWLSNLMLLEDNNATLVESSVANFLAGLEEATGPVVIVSNDVGGGIVPDNAIARAFQDRAGLLNQKIASMAGLVILMTAGLPLTLKARER